MHEMSDKKIKKGPAATYSPATNAVPSALEGLTTVFGMGTGMAPPLWPPGQKIRLGRRARYVRRRTGRSSRTAERDRHDNMVKPHG